MSAPMSDVSGYRSDSGALGQDQGVSKQLKGILTAKLPLLSAPGTVLENSLYYDINSSSVTAVEEQATFNKDRIALNNFTIGSTPSAYIPSCLFANTVFWVVDFVTTVSNNIVYPDDVSSNDPAFNFNIPEGWGFAALKNIIVYMGASSIAQIQISAMTNLLICCATCETKAKRNKMIEGAGRYLNPHDSKSLIYQNQIEGGPIFRYSNYGSFFAVIDPDINALEAVDAPWLGQAVVPLRLPWSSMAVLDKRLSLDTKLSTQPIQITLQTSNLNEFAVIGSGMQPQFKSSWANSTIQLWQEELSDKSLSVRNELLAMPEFNVGYPFQYAQSIPFEVSTLQADNGFIDTLFTMNITSIINSDLTTMLFNVTWGPRSLTNPSSGQFCPLYGEELIDIQLLLNGQRFYAFDGDDYQYVTLAKQLDDCTYDILIPSTNTTTSTSNSQAFNAQGNMYELNFSRLRSVIAESHLQNTARFTNQTFQLQFRINRGLYYLTAPGGTDPYCYNAGVSISKGYVLNMTYLYNAVYLVGGDGGTTKLITN